MARAGPRVSRFGDRVLHLPVEGLAPLAGAVSAATAHLGRPPDERPFTGHVTLARPRRRQRVGLAPFAGALLDATWEVSTFTLVSSRLGPGGSRYVVLEEFRFATHQE